MGQKVNPISNRLGVIRGWDSNWFGGKNFGDNLVEDQKIRKYLNERLAKASVSRIAMHITGLQQDQFFILLGKCLKRKKENEKESQKILFHKTKNIFIIGWGYHNSLNFIILHSIIPLLHGDSTIQCRSYLLSGSCLLSHIVKKESA